MLGAKSFRAAFISGIYGFGAAMFAKLFMSLNDVNSCHFLRNAVADLELDVCHYVHVSMKVACIVMIFLLSLLMWKNYLKSLTSFPTQISILINSFSNLALTVTMAHQLQDESSYKNWFYGPLAVTIGLIVADICSSI